jgi:hypothetical protein
VGRDVLKAEPRRNGVDNFRLKDFEEMEPNQESSVMMVPTTMA